MTIAETFSEHDHVKKYARHMLRNSLFTGSFQEKRLIGTLNSYRNVITIDANEDDFITNLLAVKRRIESTFLKTPWIGITEPCTPGAPAGFNLWVELQEEVAGRYWYRVKTVEFLPDEVRLKLEVLRPVGNESITASSRDTEQLFDLQNIKDVIKENLLRFKTEVLTFENIKSSVIFLFCLVSSVLVASVNVVQYLLEYSLKLIKEVSFFIKAITPIINNFINVFGKIVFGLYHLIYSLFRQKQPVYNAYLNIDSQQLAMNDPRERYNGYFPKALPYYRHDRATARITPLD